MGLSRRPCLSRSGVLRVVTVSSLAVCVSMGINGETVTDRTTDGRAVVPVFTGSIRAQLNRDGVLTTRSIVDVAETRWFFLSRAAVTLREEVDAPAGYRRSEIRLRSPFGSGDTAVGVEAGPLILGAIEGRGLYHRLRDPTAGGARWSALTDSSRFAPLLDPEIQDQRGVALRLRGPHFPAGGSVWYHERDGRYRIEGVDGWFSPLPDSRAGRLGLLFARVELGDGVLNDPEEEPWTFPIPPTRSTDQRLQAAFWEYGFRRRTGDLDGWQERLRPHALIEGWRRRSGYGAPLFAGGSVLSIGPAALRGTVRVAGSAPGYRTLENNRPRNSRLAASEISHRRVTALAILEGRVRWNRSRGWEDENPGALREEGELSIVASRLRSGRLPFLDRLVLSGRIRNDHGDDEQPIWRAASGLTLASSRDGRVETRFRLDGAADSAGTRQGGVHVSLVMPFGTLQRTLTGEVAGRAEWGVGDRFSHGHLSTAVSIPLGHRFRLSARGRGECGGGSCDALEWGGVLTLEYRFSRFTTVR